MNQQRDFANKKELIVIGIVLLIAILAAALIFLPRAEADTHNIAKISLNGSEMMLIDLAGEDQILDLHEKYGVPAVLELKEHRIRCMEVDCPDQICVNTGFVWRELESAICLPNRLAITIHPREEIPKDAVLQ